MTKSSCPICRNGMEKAFSATVLKKHQVGYFYCPECGFLQTEKPFWLEEAYRTAIADADTGLLQRNIHYSKKLASIIYFLLKREGAYLDIAGGYGVLTRLMRDYGFDFFWSDPYCENIFAKGFSLSETQPPFDVITAFEVVEHVLDPLEFFRTSLSETGARTVLFSTELFSGEPPRADEWWYYTLTTGQHISFYQLRTLRRIADELGLNLYSNKGIHMLSQKSLNRSAFHLVTSGVSRVLLPFIQRRMHSRTIRDHEKLKGIAS